MPEYLFYPTADKAQDGIWDYTCDKWGERQARKYINDLHVHLQALADKEIFWHLLPKKILTPEDLDIKTYLSKYEFHFIFFRELSDNNIGIMSILHDRSDMPVRLNKDFTLILKEVIVHRKTGGDNAPPVGKMSLFA